MPIKITPKHNPTNAEPKPKVPDYPPPLMENMRILPIPKQPPKKAKGGAVKMAKGGSVSSASRRADGAAKKGKTKGRTL